VIQTSPSSLHLISVGPFLSCQFVDYAPSSPSSSSDTHPLPLFWSMWPLPPISSSTHHLSCVLLPPLIVFHHMSSPTASLTLYHFLLHPRGFSPTTPFLRPIFHASLHAYALDRSANPGGSANGFPHPKGVELIRPSSIPMKQLLR